MVETPPTGLPPSSFGDSGFTGAKKQVEAKLRAEAERRAAEMKPDDPYVGMDKKQIRAAKREARKLRGTFGDYPFLDAIRPRERYIFRSDYYEVDHSFACVLGFFHDEGAVDNFSVFWGIGRIPLGLDQRVSVVVIEQVRRMTDKWVDDAFKTVEQLERMENVEQNEGTMRTKRKSAKTASDMQIASAEVSDGASYLHVHNRLLVQAPSLELLDEAVEKISRDYADRFATLKVAPYHSEQRRELADIFSKNDKKRGKGFYFTSREFAGSYHLVTNGLNDPSGEYVGYMVGDVNMSAVVMDVNDWDHHVVVADAAVNHDLGRVQVSDMWGSKIGQAALVDNQKVVHIVLNNADLNKLGPRFDSLTARMDLTRGDMNMFEVFGDVSEELSLFSRHVRKIQLMTEQAYPATEAEIGALRNTLSEVLTEFYVDQRMWVENAKESRDRIRLVGIPHKQVPLLNIFVTYLDRKYNNMASTAVRDDKKLEAYSALRGTFRSMLDNNNDLFNNHTSDNIDGVNDASRVIYDFSSLLARGRGIAMAQLVNVIGFAVAKLGEGDVVILHGAENLRGERMGSDGKDPLKEFVDEQFEQLWARGGRVVYTYSDVDKMLDDKPFNRFDDADYTLLGSMRDSTVGKYQKLLSQIIPKDLEKQVTLKNNNLTYLRRGQMNVVFWMDVGLGFGKTAKQLQVGLGDHSNSQNQQSVNGTSPSINSGNTIELSSELPSSESKKALSNKKKFASA